LWKSTSCELTGALIATVSDAVHTTSINETHHVKSVTMLYTHTWTQSTDNTPPIITTRATFQTFNTATYVIHKINDQT